MSDDFSRCMVSNSRMAARAITRRYDAYLRPFGMTATQFSLLGAIKLAGSRTVSELAELRGLDRTTLTRNLDRLEQLGLVLSGRAKTGNGRIGMVTARGEALIEQVLPAWRKAQAEMKAELSEAGFEETLRNLKRLANV